jgi:hypothetical protein
MNHVIGDSRVRGLKGLLSNIVVSEVWSRPGGKVEDMAGMVDDLTILHQGEEASRSHFYIWVGICNLTKRVKHKAKKYEEVIFSKEDAGKNRQKIFDEIHKLSKHTFMQYAAPVFCPIISMNLKVWNEFRLATSKTCELRYKDQYQKMQEDLENEVVLFNKFIIHLNVDNGVVSPMFNNDFLHCRGKGRVTPKYGELVDGCHPSGKLLLKFKKSLIKAIESNKTNHRV